MPPGRPREDGGRPASGAARCRGAEHADAGRSAAWPCGVFVSELEELMKL